MLKNIFWLIINPAVTKNMHCYYLTHIDWSFSQNKRKSQFYPFWGINHRNMLTFFKSIFFSRKFSEKISQYVVFENNEFWGKTVKKRDFWYFSKKMDWKCSKNIFGVIVNPVETKYELLTRNSNRSIFGSNYAKIAILTHLGAWITKMCKNSSNLYFFKEI